MAIDYLDNMNFSTWLYGIKLGQNGLYTLTISQRHFFNVESPAVVLKDLSTDEIKLRIQMNAPLLVWSVSDDSEQESNNVANSPLLKFVFLNASDKSHSDAINTLHEDVFSELGFRIHLTTLTQSRSDEILVPNTPVLVQPVWQSFKPSKQGNLDSDLLKIVEEKNKRDYDAHLQFYRRFYTQLNKLSKKKDDLQKRGHTEAFNTADLLERKLNDYLNDYRYTCHTKADYESFSEQCNKAINEAAPTLNQHRGWAEVLVNLTLAVAMLGVFYLAACALKYFATGSFFAHPPTSSERISCDIQNTINKLGPATAA